MLKRIAKRNEIIIIYIILYILYFKIFLNNIHNYFTEKTIFLPDMKILERGKRLQLNLAHQILPSLSMNFELIFLHLICVSMMLTHY